MSVFLRVMRVVLLSAALNITLPLQLLDAPVGVQVAFYIASVVCFIVVQVHPKGRKTPSFRLWVMDGGAELLYLFIMTMAVSLGAAVLAVFGLTSGRLGGGGFAAWLGILVIGEFLMFWNGIIRVYLTSVQLGLTLRVLGIIFGMVPVANLVMLGIIYAKVRYECDAATRRFERNEKRAAQQVCATRYPILLVHGVFFRDNRLLNYWGRIPSELEQNGAVICYGNQRSARSVYSSGAELAERIKQVCAETGADKVNIIAHSKGGLDARCAITHHDAAQYVASLTTVSTPHRGCMFAEYLLGRCPEGFVQKVENAYNKAYTALGEDEPDFLAAVKDLTNGACAHFNDNTPDAEGVLYQSVGSIARSARGGRFPLNIFYPVVKKYDGENDGMVALSSMRWGEDFIALYPEGQRGITHGDTIDLNREDYSGFDVLEFYVGLVAGLKNRGL